MNITRFLVKAITTAFAAIAILVAALTADATPLDETRCCVTPVLNADGTNHRRSDVLRTFQKIHPCPSTGLLTGACPGWAKDHVIPLESGGKDEVSNMQWLPEYLKSCKVTCKDRWERKINAKPMEIVK